MHNKYHLFKVSEGFTIKIAILGAGAMGSLFGGYLSQQNQVWLVDIDPQKVERIERDGVVVLEGEQKRIFHPKAVVNAGSLGPMDLIIVFVKAMYSRAALEANKHLIGEDTYVLTLQNGAGHEELLKDFVAPDRIIIGTTEHNSSITEEGYIHHGGGGMTRIGLWEGDSTIMQSIADSFTACGFTTEVSAEVKKHVWQKLFMNASASVLTGVLQVKLGYMLDNEHAWFLVQQLITEAVAVAKADGVEFALEEIIYAVKTLLTNVREGYTSIYADLRRGVPTEVDTINGAVVRKAKRYGVPVPSHEFVVALVHAMEGKNNKS